MSDGTGLLAVAVVPLHGAPIEELAPFDLRAALTTWVLEPVPALLILLVGAAYLYGVHRLRRRGDTWSRWRTTSFVVGGLGICVIATQSALAAYDLTLLSVHMVQHMLLSMVAPVFLALGAPVTLALRTLPGRPRRVLLRVVHSRVVAVLTFPLVAMVIFVINPWVLYYSGIYEATLRNGLLHDLNHLHFLLVGCLWFWTLLGIDPLPNRPSYPMRVVAALLTLPFHAFLGVTIMQSTALLAEDWYLGLDRTWGMSPLEDQQAAGAILWGSGDLVSLIMFAVLAVQWARAAEREARAVDRRLDLQEAQARAAAAQSGAAVTPAASAAPATPPGLAAAGATPQPVSTALPTQPVPGGSRNAAP